MPVVLEGEVTLQARDHLLASATRFSMPPRPFETEIRVKERPALSGIVTSHTGDPVYDALVVATRGADQRESVTSARGEFRLNGLSEGTWNIAAQSLSSGSGAETVIDVTDQRGQLDLVLTFSATACGALTDEAGAPLSGRWVKLMAEHDSSACVTDDDGRFCCRGLKGGEYTVSVHESPRSTAPVRVQDAPLVVIAPGEQLTGLQVRTAR